MSHRVYDEFTQALARAAPFRITEIAAALDAMAAAGVSARAAEEAILATARMGAKTVSARSAPVHASILAARHEA